MALNPATSAAATTIAGVPAIAAAVSYYSMDPAVAFYASQAQHFSLSTAAALPQPSERNVAALALLMERTQDVLNSGLAEYGTAQAAAAQQTLASAVRGQALSARQHSLYGAVVDPWRALGANEYSHGYLAALAEALGAGKTFHPPAGLVPPPPSRSTAAPSSTMHAADAPPAPSWGATASGAWLGECYDVRGYRSLAGTAMGKALVAALSTSGAAAAGSGNGGGGGGRTGAGRPPPALPSMLRLTIAASSCA